MRVTGGKYLRRRILCPPGDVRPAMDRMRESMFAVLGPLDSSSFLDLFSGSGIVGIEAASRGANDVVFVEGDYRKKRILSRNVSFVEEKTEVIISSVERFLMRAPRKFDYVYLDPPFKMEGKKELLHSLVASGLLGEGSVVIIHIPKTEDIPLIIGDLLIFDIRRYGRSHLYFYHYSPRLFREESLSL